MRKNSLVILSGPSGSGKTSILRQLARELELYRSLSCTTRAPRSGEVDGEDYVFLSRPEFEERIRKDEFAEYAEYLGELYGTPAGPLERAMTEGRVCLASVDVQGATQLRARYPGALAIFVELPAEGVLLERLRKRGSENQDQMKRRILRAREETALANEYDYRVTNDDLAEAVKRTRQIILRHFPQAETRRSNDG